MSWQPANNRVQPLSLYTQSPIRMDYNRALPPLADQPLLELRRPSNKDACFAVSALSPNMSKRFGGDWDSMSGRTSLLDRYLGQQAISPIVQELPKAPFEQALQKTSTPAHANVPANSKALWALMSQTQSSKATSERSSQAASAAQRRRRERGPPPPLPPSIPSSTRSREEHRRRNSPPAMSSTHLAEGHGRRTSPPAIPFTHSREDRERRAAPSVIPSSTHSREHHGRRTSPPPVPPATHSREGSGRRTPPMPLSTHSREDSGRKPSPPPMPPSTRPREDLEGRGYPMVHRLEGFPIPRALSIIQDRPAPSITGSTISSLACGLEQLGKESSSSRVDSWIGPPLEEQAMPPRGREAPRYPGLPPAPNAKLKSYVPKIKTVRFAASKSNASSLKSPTVYEYDCDRSWPSPSPTTFSPVTPVAMTFEYPAIFENTPPLEHVPWDNDMGVIEDSPQDSVLSVISTKAVILSPDRGRLFARDDGYSPRLRARSHSPPRTPFPGESPLHTLPNTIYTPIEQKVNFYRKVAPKDDFDLTYDVSEEITDGVRLLDRTAIWVLSGKTRDTMERKHTTSVGSVGNDREAILRSYFHRF